MGTIVDTSKMNMFLGIFVVICAVLIQTEAADCPGGVSNCALGEHDCDVNAVCTDEMQPSGFCAVTCTCKEGFVGDGTRGNCQAQGCVNLDDVCDQYVDMELRFYCTDLKWRDQMKQTCCKSC